jgi:beta-glucanase (GH16 family)
VAQPDLPRRRILGWVGRLLVLAAGIAYIREHQMTTTVFDDEFTGPAGSAPDPSKWSYDIGQGSVIGGNSELEYYTDSRENSYLDGEGHLVIAATLSGGKYYSARLKTLGHFALANGTWTARIKLDPQPGTWPAWWLLGQNFPYPQCGEIDILENYNGGDYVETTVWTPSGGAMKYNKYADVPVDDNWHVYQMTKTANGPISFSKDGGAPYLTVPNNGLPNWLYDNGNPLYMILNLAIGGSGGGNPADTVFPVTMLVDYVHVQA